jgi:alpha-ribazole phosphatase
LLARHGETAYNAQARYQGQTDLRLSRVGRRQAAALASRLAHEGIHAVYASDLRRASETAATIAAPHRLPVRGEPRLREMAFGAWEGLTHAEIGERDPQALAAWQADPLGSVPPGGESLTQMAARVRSAFDSIIALHPEQTVLLVAHGGPLRVLLCLALGLPCQAHWRFRLDAASVSELCVCEGDASLIRLNDTACLNQAFGGPAGGGCAGQLILILGGARSGKSAFAQQLARELGGDQVLFMATAEAGDEEMQQRIEKHRHERPAGWRTLEVQRDVGQAILDHDDGSRVILVDCLSLLVANLLLDVPDPFSAGLEAQVVAEVEGLVSCAKRLDGHLIVVSNEVGLGLVPPYPVGRAYRDLLGRANQVLARNADQVYMLLAGIPVPIKGADVQRDL